MNFKNLALAIGATLVLSSGANATTLSTLTFDDVATPGGLAHLSTYGGLNWDNTGVINTTLFPYASGYQNADTSGTNVAYNEFASVAAASKGSTFDFIGANFTAAWNEGLQLTVDGWLGGSKVAGLTRTITLNTSGPTSVYDFNFTGIDKLTFTSTGGTHNTVAFGVANPSYGVGGTHFAMDDFQYTTPAPEPSSMVLGLMGLSSVLGLRRKKA
jgi:hypothetical protein